MNRKVLLRRAGRDAPRIHGELLKLCIDIGESSVSKYMVHGRKPPSQSWRTFLENHAQRLVSIDFFTVATLRFQILYVFLVLAHDRRRIVHFNVTGPMPRQDSERSQKSRLGSPPMRCCFRYDSMMFVLFRHLLGWVGSGSLPRRTPPGEPGASPATARSSRVQRRVEGELKGADFASHPLGVHLQSPSVMLKPA